MKEKLSFLLGFALISTISLAQNGLKLFLPHEDNTIDFGKVYYK
jgi:hypothetical protein